MKKLLTLLFTAVVAFALAMPVYAQETGGQETTKSEKKEKKAKKEKKSKKEKKEKKEGESKQ